MDIFDIITGQLFDKKVVNELATEQNEDPEKVEKLTELALPTMLEALKRNAATVEGRESLASALNKHEKDSDDIDLLDFFKKADTTDGNKILGHMFGNQKEEVTNNLANQTGLDISSVIGLLTKYAPMILTMLALKNKFSTPKQEVPQTSSVGKGLDLTDILGDLTGRAQQKTKPGLMDIIGSFLK